MKYNLENTIKAFNKGEEMNFLFFWGHQPSKDGKITKTCFSQWWVSPFTVDGISYQTAEHWMMCKKAELFGDEEQKIAILGNNSPAFAKKCGRKVLNFNPNVWQERSFDIVVEGNFHKFSQNDGLKEFLLSTGDDIIVEASPFDNIWGIGTQSHLPNPSQWKGKNLLGFALMEVRDRLI